MKKLYFLLIVLLPVTIQSVYSQNIDFSKYAVALSEITTFADNPGFKEEIIIEKTTEVIEWIKGEDDYNYTQDLKGIRVFGYKVLFKSNNNIILGVYYDSEGTATNSYIFKVTTTETKLKLNEIIAGGDRCHNAVILDEVQIKDNVMSFSTLITPNKLINWFSESNNDINFDDCMVCCIGFANFKYDFKKEIKEFESIRIIEERLQENTSLKTTYDEFVKEEPLKLSLLLNEKELNEFIKACLKK